jgi:hypothetical protein
MVVTGGIPTFVAMKNILFALLVITTALVNAQQLTVSPAQLNFGTVTEISPDSQQVTITNSTGYDITVTGYRFYTFYGSPAFSTTGGVFTVPAGGSQSIWIKFTPVHNIYHNSELFILNDGHRGALRVDLLGQGRYSKSYYATTENLAEEVLKDTLHEILDRNFYTPGYSVARDSMFMSYDNEKINGAGAASNTIECVYTGRKAVGYTDRTDCQTNYSFNTEHTFPQNFFNSLEPMRADLYHLFPTDDLANNARASLPFGTVSNPSWQQGGSKGNSTTFEPRDVHKGRTARAMFYFVIRYQNYNNFLTNQEGILRQWHEQFPPNTTEVTRGNKIFQLQNNRNPFIDYPQFIDRITTISNTSIGNVAASSDTPDDTINYSYVQAPGAAQYTYWIANDGNSPLTISGLTLNPNTALNFLNNTGTTATIQPGEARAIEIELAMAPPGYFSGTLNYIAQGTGLLANVSVPIKAQISLTGLSEITNGNGYTIYPNPATDRLCIDPFPVNGHLNIYDLQGRKIDGGNSVNSSCISVEDIRQPGTYLLEWTGPGGRTIRERWIKTAEL